MKLHKKVIGNLMVAPGEHADLERRSTSQTKTGWLDSGSKSAQRDLAERDLVEFTAELEVGQELLYAAHIALDRTQMQIEDRLVNLTPGMAVTAEIKTGQRRVIEYLLSPLLRYKQESLRER